MADGCPCVVGHTYGEKEKAGLSCVVLAKRAKKDNSIKYFKVRSIIGTHERPFARVSAVVNKETNEYWVNLVTGTLYDDVGACLTSDLLRIVK